MSTIGVVIGIYGNLQHWRPLAERAMESVRSQTRPADEALISTGATLDEARNRGVERLMTDWVVNLDADDTLDPGYLGHMAVAMATLPPERSFLLQPATLGVYPDGTEDAHPVVIPAARSILERNHLVVATAIRRDQFLRLGGFAALPALEDWHLWVRAILDGAEVVVVPGAVYRVGVRPQGRNQDRGVHGRVYQQVRAEFLPRARQLGLA